MKDLHTILHQAGNDAKLESNKFGSTEDFNQILGNPLTANGKQTITSEDQKENLGDTRNIQFHSNSSALEPREGTLNGSQQPLSASFQRNTGELVKSQEGRVPFFYDNFTRPPPTAPDGQQQNGLNMIQQPLHRRQHVNINNNEERSAALRQTQQLSSFIESSKAGPMQPLLQLMETGQAPADGLSQWPDTSRRQRVQTEELLYDQEHAATRSDVLGDPHLMIKVEDGMDLKAQMTL